MQILDGAAVEAFGLGLIAEEDGPGGIAGHLAVEAEGEEVVAILLAGDFDALGQLGVHAQDGGIGAVEGFIEAGGEEAGFEAGDAEEALLGEGDALEGEALL